MAVSEATFTPPKADCDPSRYSAPDNMASETEVSQFLAALCVVLRPQNVLETGSYLGHTSEAMGRALVGYGHLDSLERNPAHALIASQKCMGLPVTIHTGNSLSFNPQVIYDLFFIDSDRHDRVQELERFRRFASPKAMVAVHDSRDLTLGEAIRKHLKAVYLPTPRGLALGRWR